MKSFFKELPPPIDSSFTVKEEVAVQFSQPFHFHNGYEFTFIIKGHGKFYGGNQVMNFRDGDVYFFGPLFPHYFVNEKSADHAGTCAHSVIVQFQDDFLGKDVFEKPEFNKIKSLLGFEGLGLKINSPEEQIKKLFIELSKEKGVKRIIYLIELLNYISTLDEEETELLTLNSETSNTKKRFSKLDAVYRYVLEHFKKDVTSKKAASLACLNDAAFCRYFKRQTNKTFSQFVNHVRVIHATSLLRDKNLSILEICFECGFNNLSYFNRQFKKIIGKSPMEYRKEYRK